MTLSEELYEFPQLSDIETWLRRHPTTPQVESVEDIAQRLLGIEASRHRTKDQLKNEFNKQVTEIFGEVAIAKLLHEHAGKFVHFLEFLGPLMNMKEVLLQTREIYGQYQDGSSVTEIAERELVTLIFRIFRGVVTGHPFTMAGTIVAERFYDRIQFGRKFTISKAEISQSLEELLNQMRTEGFNVDTIVHA